MSMKEPSNRVEEAITEYWGKRCPDFDETCCICQAWADYDSLAGIISQENIEGVKRGLEDAIAYLQGERDGFIVHEGSGSEQETAASPELTNR